MLALITEEEVRIFRRTGAGVRHWLTVVGGPVAIARAIETARQLRLEALAAGDWCEPHRFSLDPLEPVPARPVSLRLLR